MPFTLSHKTLQSTLQRGWYFGSEAFREMLVEKLQGQSPKTGNHRTEDGYHDSQNQDHQQAMAERIVQAGWKTLTLKDVELKAFKKADPQKALVALAVQRSTSVPQNWVRERLVMGHPSATSRAISLARKTFKSDAGAQSQYDQILKMSQLND